MEKTGRTLKRRDMLTATAAAAAAPFGNAAMANEKDIPTPDYEIPGNGFHGKEENKREWKKDDRSFKVVFLSHCMLNQNARYVDVADFPAMFDPLVDFLQKKQIGMIQMPCPELYCLGLGRNDVRPGLEHTSGMARLQRMLDDVIFTIREYQYQKFEVVAIMGKQGSPACGVTETWYNESGHGPGEGVYIREMRKRLAKEKIDIPIQGIADFRQDEAIEWLKERV